MRRFIVLSLLLAGFIGDAVAAVPVQRRGQSASGNTATASTGAKKTTAARAATNSRTAPRTTAAASAPKTVNRGRAATTTVTKAPVVAARAGTTQKVIGSGTKVATAAKNIVVSEECQAKYEGCMDAFCMLDNETGGRCLCSDKNSEYDDILAEIEKLDQQSYQMATFGVEKIEMGSDADAAIAMANAAADSVTGKDDTKKARKALDLSMWNTTVDFDAEEDIFGASASSPLDGKEGDALHRAAAEICVAQIPECASDLQMLQMMYAQRIKSDCTAYENSLKQQKNSSTQKLAAAEQALREAALEQYRSANKYDLGQCTVEFKKCMQTTGGCGDDFSGCATMNALDTTSTRKSSSKKKKNYQIKGAVSNIEISASTYDALMAKKPLCETVTKSCVAVADQVWDTFLKEVAPQVKNAEFIAEDNARQNCIGNISSCFQKACKDNIDPNDPDGSYDMCLSRPGTMLNVCKVPLNNCGIDASSETKAQESSIWEFVVARLAAMRVDSCTTEVKECLQSEDRCGEDYTQCIGLDTDTIIRMCPYDKLTGCQKVYGTEDIRGDDVYDELATMVQGIMLNIDNNFLTECQNAANEAMIKVCGDTENCNGLAVDDNIGARSLEYKICEYNGASDDDDITYESANCRVDADAVTENDYRNNVPLAGILSGIIFWEEVEFDENGNLEDVDTYLKKTGLNLNDSERQFIKSELGTLQTSINNAAQAIEADPTVQYCMTGRTVQGMRKNATQAEETSPRQDFGDGTGRFPQLTKQMRMTIATAALQLAKENYYEKYDELNEKMLEDFKKVGQKVAELQAEDNKNARREPSRRACIQLARNSTAVVAIPQSTTNDGEEIGSTAIKNGTVIMPYTSGNSNLAAIDDVKNHIIGLKMTGYSKSQSLSLIREVSTTFNWDTLVCHKCVINTTCGKVKKKFLGSRYCKYWNEPKETCEDIQF